MPKKIYIYTDGGSRGNPGPAGIGILILDENKRPLKEYKEYIGKTTNNQAEYKALIKALELASSYTKGEVFCTLDSELVVRQLDGQYSIKNNNLKNLFLQLKKIEKGFEKISYTHVKRENPFIKRVDMMVNEVLDEKERFNAKIYIYKSFLVIH